MDLDAPFRASDAVAAGAVTWGRLRGPEFVRLGPDVHVRAGTPLDVRTRIVAALLRYPDAVVAGPAAGALWCRGEKALGAGPVGVLDLVRPGPGVRPAPGVRVRREHLEADEVAVRDGIALTTPARTVLDLLRRLPRELAVVTADAVARDAPTSAAEVRALMERRPRARGLAAVRERLPLVDPASRTPLVSRVRLLLHDEELPPPRVGVHVRPAAVDAPGAGTAALIANEIGVDLAWTAYRCAVLCGAFPAGHGIDLRVALLRQAGWGSLVVDDPPRSAGEVVVGVRCMLRAGGRALSGASSRALASAPTTSAAPGGGGAGP